MKSITGWMEVSGKGFHNASGKKSIESRGDVFTVCSQMVVNLEGISL
jgi:hypothetical protein